MPTTDLVARRQSPDTLERYWTFQFGTLPSIARVIEPCAGAGWMVDVIHEHVQRDRIAAFDIDPARDITQADTLVPGFFEQIAMHVGDERRTTALITNPPFSRLADYQRRGQMFGFTALLGRITWLEPTKDREGIRDPDRVIVLPRTSFAGPIAKKGADSATAAWFYLGRRRTRHRARQAFGHSRAEVARDALVGVGMKSAPTDRPTDRPTDHRAKSSDSRVMWVW